MESKLSIFSLKPQAVDLDNGNVVYIRRLSALERVEWIEFLQADKDGGSLKLALKHSCKLLALSLCNQDGTRIFSDTEEGQIAQMDSTVIDKLQIEAMRLNGLGDGADEVKKK